MSTEEIINSKEEKKSVRAIFFPEDCTIPFLVSVPLQYFDDEEDSDCYLVDIDEVKEYISNPVHLSSRTEGGTETWKYSLDIYYEDEFTKTDRPVNRSIQKLILEKQPWLIDTFWRGNVIVIKDKDGLVDIGYNDIDKVVDYLINFVVNVVPEMRYCSVCGAFGWLEHMLDQS